MEPRLQPARPLLALCLLQLWHAVLRINDPFYKLVATARGGVIIDEPEIERSAEY
jgi:hypothetical protein